MVFCYSEFKLTFVRNLTTNTAKFSTVVYWNHYETYNTKIATVSLMVHSPLPLEQAGLCISPPAQQTIHIQEVAKME